MCSFGVSAWFFAVSKSKPLGRTDQHIADIDSAKANSSNCSDVEIPSKRLLLLLSFSSLSDSTATASNTRSLTGTSPERQSFTRLKLSCLCAIILAFSFFFLKVNFFALLVQNSLSGLHNLLLVLWKVVGEVLLPVVGVPQFDVIPHADQCQIIFKPCSSSCSFV